MEKIRRASHAGSWYTDNPSKLAEELDGWLRASGLSKSPDVRGVIAPHAGYSYSGRAAAFAFGNIDPSNISRIFLLGPSHHYYTPKCALTRATVYRTPIGDLPVDLEVNEELKATGKFELMDIQVDEAEHSMEMHLPYLAKVFHGFNYMHHDKKHGAIHKSIEALDKMGMEIIETGDPDAFKRYLLDTDNTICGRHPISVLPHVHLSLSLSLSLSLFISLHSYIYTWR
ncbi:hypothetical protein RJ640_015071 [Escallonia rubra]|uniref:Protein MEMO1 n=1 Tax=Escallonia rubra TaxID=112253 RepID=A0AA88UL99_9ASTE|nr:hypothetical protein RJ640_015071 [Escallonia rubra]